MKTIKYKGNEYNIPVTWKDVTVAMQIKAAEVENKEEYIKILGLLTSYTGIPVELLKSSKTTELSDVMKMMKFLNKPIDDTPIFEFEFKGEKYYVNESLLNQQFQDFLAAQTAIEEYKENHWKQLTYLLAIMAKREGETLDSYDIHKRAEMFMGIDVETCRKVASFFLSSQKGLDFITQFSTKEVQGSIMQSKLKEANNSLTTLKKVRGGSLHIRLWIGISRRLIKYYKQVWEKYFNSQA